MEPPPEPPITKSGLLMVCGPSCTGKSTLISKVRKGQTAIAKISVKKLSPYTRDEINQAPNASCAYAFNAASTVALPVATLVSRTPVSNIIYQIIKSLYGFVKNAEWGRDIATWDHDAILNHLEKLFKVYDMQFLINSLLRGARPLILTYDGQLGPQMERKQKRGLVKDSSTMDAVYLKVEWLVYEYFSEVFGWPKTVVPNEIEAFDAYVSQLAQRIIDGIEERGPFEDVNAMRDQEYTFDGTCQPSVDYPLSPDVYVNMPR